MADIGRTEPIERLGQGRDLRFGDQLQASGQLGQVPEHGLGLTRKGIEALAVEIGGGKGRVIVGQKAPGAVVETLARHVQIVGVQHPVDEAGGNPFGRQSRRGLDHGGQEAGRVAGRDGGMIQVASVLQQRLDVILAAVIGGPLEGPEADMAVRQPHHDRRAGGGGFVVAFQRLAGLDQRQDAAGGSPQAFQHGGGQDLAHAALQRQPPVAAPRPRRLTGPLGSQVEKSTWRGAIARDAVARCLSAVRFSKLRREEAAPVAEVGVVGAELMAVIAHGDRAGLAGQGLEAAKVA
ncbi:hypothetical protein D3C72_893750 [compost metagenome]